ncbi:hypothetical protein OIU11_01970 [Bacillus cereus]|uniref:hypothetical protein n=1 Tax=Bacillus cereus TaxID=1396 RepID=UPI002226FC0F|nr:hypothetical protein [Bacillus cereus]UYY94325.1 hypothetical protein OIU11_01970 [Bacillus cereus]
MEKGKDLIKPERLVRLTIRSYDEFIKEENCKPLEAASMVISNVAKAMMASNLNKVLVLKCLLELARQEKDSMFEERISILIKDTTKQLDKTEEKKVDSLVNNAVGEKSRENGLGWGS